MAYRARVIAGATGAAVAAILVAGTFLLAPTNSGLTCGPCGAPPAWIEPGAVSTGAGVNLCNFTILGGGQWDGADWNSVTLRLMNGSVPISTTAEGWNLTVYGTDTALVAVYDLQPPAPFWSVGGTTAVESGYFLLTAPSSTSLSGDFLTLSIKGGGGESLEIP